MTLRSLLYIAPLMVAAFTSCDEVKEGNRFIEMETIEAKKGVLVLDFTGQKCTNCPEAHIKIENLEKQYGELFIPVSIHAGVQSLSIDSKRYIGLATPVGEAYDVAFEVAPNGYPSIIVDYMPTVYGGTGAEWVSVVRDCLEKTSVIDFDYEARLIQNEEGEYEIKLTTTFLAADNLHCNYQIWILEDGIRAEQMGVNGNPRFDPDYIHNNVFRAPMNGDWGEPVTFEANVYKTLENSYVIQGEWESTWNVENLKLVMFCYSESDGVLQARQVKLSQNAEEDSDEPADEPADE